MCHGVTCLFAALTVATGVVIHETHRLHRAIEFRSFWSQLNKAVPAELCMHLVLDNASSHKTPAIHSWLLRRLRFHLHFMPTLSVWSNLIERCLPSSPTGG